MLRLLRNVSAVGNGSYLTVGDTASTLKNSSAIDNGVI